MIEFIDKYMLSQKGVPSWFDFVCLEKFWICFNKVSW